ncbi:MAG TPA: fluoride efflux transporter CrcB [Acidimicrobiales bacterium]|nr:fluoride efflux transporter CrcB [Acidimicrobiales bacterium]
MKTPGRSQLAIGAAVAAGGTVGAVTRYLLSTLWPTAAGRFPWATFVINVSGSLCLGFLLRFMAERLPRDRFSRAVLCTGGLGAYTTFSTFAVEAVLLARDGRGLEGIGYVLASVGASLAAVVLGTLAAGLALGPERRVTGLRS